MGDIDFTPRHGRRARNYWAQYEGMFNCNLCLQILSSLCVDVNPEHAYATRYEDCLTNCLFQSATSGEYHASESLTVQNHFQMLSSS